MKQNFFGQIALRIASKSPRFWRILQIVAAIVIALAWGAQQLLDRGFVVIGDAAMRERWEDLLGDIMLASGASGVTAACSTTKAELVDEETKKAVIKDAAGQERL